MLRRELLSVCQDYAESHGNVFNSSKTVGMTFKAKNSPAMKTKQNRAVATATHSD